MKQLLFIFILISSTFCSAQYGTIKGLVKDSKKNECYYCSVLLKQNGNVKARAKTNFDGEFKISSLLTGDYDILVSNVRNDTTIKNIFIKADTINFIKIELPQCKYDKKNKFCPNCNASTRVVPIKYGLMGFPRHQPYRDILNGSGFTWRRKEEGLYNLEDQKYYYGGSYQMTACEPNWYCNKCKTKF